MGSKAANTKPLHGIQTGSTPMQITLGQHYNVREKPTVCVFLCFLLIYIFWTSSSLDVVVVFFTLTDRASTIPSNIRGCQSGTWSQRGTEVNGSHHGDNPLLRPTGNLDRSKSRQKVMRLYKRWHRPINIKTIHQTSLLHIESILDRHGLY